MALFAYPAIAQERNQEYLNFLHSRRQPIFEAGNTQLTLLLLSFGPFSCGFLRVSSSRALFLRVGKNGHQPQKGNHIDDPHIVGTSFTPSLSGHKQLDAILKQGEGGSGTW